MQDKRSEIRTKTILALTHLIKPRVKIPAVKPLSQSDKSSKTHIKAIILLTLLTLLSFLFLKPSITGLVTKEPVLTLSPIQSHPVVGGNWTVRLDTKGAGNLTITAINGTTWSNENEDNQLKFLEIRCGNEVLDYQWIDNSVFIENYECSETGYEISKVLIAGKHTVEFRFGDDVKYAHNSPAAPNVTLSSPGNGSTDTDGNIIFQCNVTDDLAIATIYLYKNISYTGIVEIYSNDFETTAGFLPDGSNTAPWERGNVTISPINGCYSGANCWGTDLDANYFATGPYDDFLTQNESVSLADYSEINLTFYHYRYFEDATTIYDAGVVDIVWDNGSVQRITPIGGYTGTVDSGAGSSLAGQEAYGNHGSGWEKAIFNLTPYVGNEPARIRFYFAADTAGNDVGWFIDDVNITGVPLTWRGNQTIFSSGWRTPTAIYDKCGEEDYSLATNMIDDNTNTYWGHVVTENHSIAFDMGKTYNITKVRVYHVQYMSTHGPGAIYVSDDPTDWGSSLGATTANYYYDPTGWDEIDITDKSGRYINLTGETDEYEMYWYEFDAYVARDIPENSTSYNASFNVTGLSDGSYKWNCLAYDNASQSAWGDANWSFTVDTTPPTIISDCAVLSTAGATYTLTANISNSTTSNCINITAENVTLDCRRNIIDGDDAADHGIVIKRESAGTTNATIRNCKLIDWNNAEIYLYQSDNNTLTNVTIDSSYNRGIYLFYSNNNTLTNVTTSSSRQRGIYIYYSNNNILTNVTANSNSPLAADGILLQYAYNNTFRDIIANDNDVDGIELQYSKDNTFTNITANDNGHYGIYLSSSSDNNTVTNITANSNGYAGIHLYWFSENNILINVTANNNNLYGISFSYSTNNILRDMKLINNGYHDLYIDAASASYCNHNLTNIIGTDDKPIVYYNSTVTIEHCNNNVSQIILCNADKSTIYNVTMDHTDKENNGILLAHTDNANLTNVSVSDSYYGIYLYSSDSNALTNITANSNSWYGIYLYSGSSSNVLANIINSLNNHTGIYLYQSDNNILTNVTVNSNSQDGISLYSSDSNTLKNIVANSNDDYGIYLCSSSDSNTINESELWNNTDAGFYSCSADSNSNLIYNNLFNNTVNFGGSIGANFWNTTKQEGTNIIGQGWIGGNYWANLTADGYSETCWDRTGDYICEDSYTLATDNIDYLPLTSNSDAVYPLIDFDSGTLANNSFKNQTFIYANWTYTETNLQNITAELFNTTGLVNRTGFTTATYEINWTITELNERYYYNISILDNASNFNKTEARNITIDTTNPTIPTLSLTPDTAASLDPDVQINVTANITDALAGVNTTVLQYKFHSAAAFTNVTMRYSSTTKLYNGSFTPNAEGEWTYRVWANDTANNIYNTTATNATVEYDYTWFAGKNESGAISGIVTTNREILIIDINNTGDSSLSFDLTDTAPYGSSYNQTIPFTIAAKGTKNITFNVTFGSTTRDDAVKIIINSTTSSASPGERILNVTLTSYAGGPYFDVVIDTYSTSINQSRTAIIRAYVKNIGNETSIQTWLNWTLPSGVTNTTGNTTQNVTLNETSNLTAGTKMYSTLNITVNETTVEIGSITIYAKATGLNSTGGAVSKEVNKSITITCYSGDGVCGNGCNYHTDTDCEIPQNVTTTTTTAGGGGGGVAPVFKAEVTYELIRGRDQIFILPLENPYSSKTLCNIRVSASGYLAQYIKIEPPENVSADETGEIKVKILAPSYFTTGMHNLTFTIQSIAKEKGTADISRTEKRYVYLSIHELGKEDSVNLINEIENYLEKMKKLDLRTEGIQELFDKALDVINKSDYESVNEMYEQSKELAEAALDSYSIVKGLEEKLNDTSKYKIKTPKTDRLVNLAKSALERGDYLLASERVKDAQLTYIIETKGKFGLIYYIRKNTFEFFLYTIAIVILLTFMYFRTRISVINYNLKGLQQEEDTLLGLMRVVQKECFEEKKMSMSEYNDAMLQYEDRLSKAVQRTIELEAAKTNLLKFKHTKLQLERKRLLDLMKTTQEKYLKEGVIETQVYNNKMHSFVSRLSELEENLALQEAKQSLRKRKLFWRMFYSVFKTKTKRLKT